MSSVLSNGEGLPSAKAAPPSFSLVVGEVPRSGAGRHFEGSKFDSSLPLADRIEWFQKQPGYQLPSYIAHLDAGRDASPATFSLESRTLSQNLDAIEAISSNDSSSSGTGVAPSLVVSPSSGDFGQVTIGTTSPLLHLTATNNTTATFSYAGSTGLSEFTVEPGTCHLVNGDAMLSPGQSCVFTAVFSPRVAGKVSGSIQITSSAGTVSFPFSGTGVAPSLVVSPSSGDFGQVTIGTTSPLLHLTATNNTTATFRYAGSTGLGEFTVEPGTCHLVNGDAMLSPGQSCVFTAVFTPRVAGKVSGSIQITSSAGTVSFPFSGTGVAQAIPPKANPGGPYTAQAGNVVSFDGSKSTAPAGQTLSYSWNFTDGGTATGVNPTHIYATEGSYQVILTVTASGGGTSTAFTSVTITPAPITVRSITPANHSTGVSVNTTVGLTFSDLVDPNSVNSNSVNVQVDGTTIAGSYTVNGSVVTFTPLAPLPGNATVSVTVSSIVGLAGNRTASPYGSTFTTGPAADMTPPTVVMVTPKDKTTGTALNGQVTITFSKPMNPVPFGSNYQNSVIALLANDVKQSFNVSVSADNRTVVLNNLNLPGSTVITLAIPSAATDLNGDALADYTSQFTTAAVIDMSHATVVSQRPGNGATGVQTTASPLVLFMSKPLNANTVSGALHVSVNGNRIPGTVEVTAGGQAIEFTPTTAWTYGALVQVSLDATAFDNNGISVLAYTGSFAVIGDPSETPMVLSMTPVDDALNVPTNAVIDIRYSEPLDPVSVNSTNVSLVYVSLGQDVSVPSTPTLDETGTVLHIVLASPLNANGLYLIRTNSLKGATGKGMPNRQTNFVTGTGAASTPVTVTTVSPANKLRNVPLNALIGVLFSGPIDPVTVSGTTISLTGGGATAVPATISFTNNNQSVQITPQAPLPASTALTLTVKGVTDLAGKPVTAFTSGFTTGTGIATTNVSVVASDPAPRATDVPVNPVISIQMSAPLDGTTLNTSTFQVLDDVLIGDIVGTYSLSTDGMTVYFVPTAPLAVRRSYSVFFQTAGVTDLAGNLLLSDFCENTCVSAQFTFTTGFSPSTAAPKVLAVSPGNAVGAIPINAQLVVSLNEPVDPESLGGVTLSANGTTMPITTALSNGNQLLTISPSNGLLAKTTYTLTVAGVSDPSRNAMTAPFTSTFTTSGAADFTALTIASVSPASAATGVPLNAKVQVRFSKQVDVVALTGGYFTVSGPSPVKGSLLISPDGLSVTFTPASNLAPDTTYCGIVNGVIDIEGQPLVGQNTNCFTTGTAVQSSGPVVVNVSPGDNSLDVPVNATVSVGLSEPLSATAVAGGSVTVNAGGAVVAGTVSALDPMTLLFTPSKSLAVNTSYQVSAGGFTDVAGNTATPFTSRFRTASTPVVDTVPPSVQSIFPALGTQVATTTPIVVTFSEAIDPLSVTSNSLNVKVNGLLVAGSYVVNDWMVTFTPLTALPGGATVFVNVLAAVKDLAGNSAIPTFSTFTTAPTADTTVPTVVMVTPGNGSTGIGISGQVTLTFSKSMNPAPFGSSDQNSCIGLLAGGVKRQFNVTVSVDNRTVILNYGNLPPSAVMTLAISNAAVDLSGNRLAFYTSQFTTAAAFDPSQASVVTQRPGNGATSVSTLASPVVLLLNKPLNVQTVAGALHVSQNGQLVSGTVKVTGDGAGIEFTPSSAWSNEALVELFLDATALDTQGNSVTPYKGSFTVIDNPTTLIPKVLEVNPYGDYNVPLNPVIELLYDHALDPSTVNATNVLLSTYLSGVRVPSTVELDTTGTVVRFVPKELLAANTEYGFAAQNLIGVNGQNASYFGGPAFTTGESAQTTSPKVTVVSPANKLGNIPLNANISISFNAMINPLTVNGTTISLMGGGQTVLPASIAFTNNAQTVVITPEALLPPSTAMTINVKGVEDAAGNSVVPFTSGFTTGIGVAVATPILVASNPVPNDTNVPLNATLNFKVSAPLDGTTVNNSSFHVFDTTSNTAVSGTTYLSADSLTASFVPTTQLAADHTYGLSLDAKDVAGNALSYPFCGNCSYSFTTGSSASTTAPKVTSVFPATGSLQVPIEYTVFVNFNEDINEESLGGVVLSANGNVVRTEAVLNGGSTQLVIFVTDGLLPNTKYTLTVAGVSDLSGNAQTSTFTSTFTTGSVF